MSTYHCSCGFAVNDAAQFGDHLRAVFDRPDGTGTDGRVHDEIDAAPGPDRPPGLVCACGFVADGPAEFDDHALLALTPPDSIGNDGQKHVPVDPSTPPEPWIITRTPGE